METFIKIILCMLALAFWGGVGYGVWWLAGAWVPAWIISAVITVVACVIIGWLAVMWFAYQLWQRT